MKIAIVAAGFTPGEADGLRRAMATFRHAGIIDRYEDRLIEGMVANGYARDFAERCFRQIEGFGEYGFPESHAASFALLVYVSAWVKHHYPDVFCAAILNAQPMGFYAPAQLVRDAREHGVEIRPADVNHSDWDAVLEPGENKEAGRRYAVRLGLRQIKGLHEAAAARIVGARAHGGRFDSVEALGRRAALDRRALDALAAGDAFGSLDLRRRGARWAARGTQAPLPLFAATGEGADAPLPALPDMGAAEEVYRDYQTTRLSLKGHPMQFFRDGLSRERFLHCADLAAMKDGAWVSVAGLVLIRQRPGSGEVIFITLEDETGIANLIVWPRMAERYRRTVLTSRVMAAHGVLQKEGRVIHLVTRRLEDRSHLLEAMAGNGAGSAAEEFGDAALANADEVAHGSCVDPRKATQDKQNRRADLMRAARGEEDFGDGHVAHADLVKTGFGPQPRDAEAVKRRQAANRLKAGRAMPRSRDFH